MTKITKHSKKEIEEMNEGEIYQGHGLVESSYSKPQHITESNRYNMIRIKTPTNASKK